MKDKTKKKAAYVGGGLVVVGTVGALDKSGKLVAVGKAGRAALAKSGVKAPKQRINRFSTDADIEREAERLIRDAQKGKRMTPANALYSSHVEQVDRHMQVVGTALQVLEKKPPSPFRDAMIRQFTQDMQALEKQREALREVPGLLQMFVKLHAREVHQARKAAREAAEAAAEAAMRGRRLAIMPP